MAFNTELSMFWLTRENGASKKTKVVPIVAE
jgi:hypothetical protein